jgi:lipid II:glycine glycyltransferase (peptidoglycan interpeptide bridge formation enzyme)
MTEWAGYMNTLGWKVETLGKGKNKFQVFVRPLRPLPLSVMKVQRITQKAFDGQAIRQLAKKHRAMVTYVEIDEPAETPDGFDELIGMMKGAGFRASFDAMLPTKSRWVDLSLSLREIKAGMKAKTRYNVGLALRRGVTVRWLSGKALVAQKELMDIFFEMFEKNNKRIGVFGVPRRWFEAHMRSFLDNLWVAMAYKDLEFLAGAVFFKTTDRLVYFYNGSTDRGRRDMVPTLIIWEALVRGKKAGLSWLDFEGIEDERKPNKRWRGFSRFKQGFGGTEMYYPPVFVGWFFDLIKVVDK